MSSSKTINETQIEALAKAVAKAVAKETAKEMAKEMAKVVAEAVAEVEPKTREMAEEMAKAVAEVELKTKDLAGLREQILDNVRLIFQGYYKGAIPLSSITYHVAIVSEKNDLYFKWSYKAEAVWGPENKPFLESMPRETPQEALECLLQLSASNLANLRRENRSCEIVHDFGNGNLPGSNEFGFFASEQKDSGQKRERKLCKGTRDVV